MKHLVEVEFMKFYRAPTKQEKQLIELLVRKSSLGMLKDWENGLLVCPMNDGEMGSLYLLPQGKQVEGRRFGKQISEFQFTDADGVEVIVSLNIDSDGYLLELDIWKTNFGKLLKLPDL